MKIEVRKHYPIVVKIKVNDDGEKQKFAKWHYVNFHGSGENALCTGEYFGEGEGSAEFDKKRGKITCPECVRIIKELKAVRL